jgi:signal transduction histidine kinase
VTPAAGTGARVRLLDYRLPGNGWFTFEFLGFGNCYNRAPEAFGRQLETEAGEALDIVVEGDHGRLMQVLANLISNAAKYSPENGCITLGAEPRENTVRVWVKDEGPGIPESFRKQIFQKFSQADSSDTRMKGGTGLGLSIAKAIIDHHKGNIDFKSVAGEGTTFYFELPILRGAAQPELAKQFA